MLDVLPVFCCLPRFQGVTAVTDCLIYFPWPPHGSAVSSLIESNASPFFLLALLLPALVLLSSPDRLPSPLRDQQRDRYAYSGKKAQGGKNRKKGEVDRRGFRSLTEWRNTFYIRRTTRVKAFLAKEVRTWVRGGYLPISTYCGGLVEGYCNS